MKKIAETSRLLLREFNLDDTAFIVNLLNSPGWLRFIGDRNVHDEASAKNYLQNGPMKLYAEHGFGLWHVSRLADSAPVGMCGLLKREHLDAPDIGFALLPEFAGQGYAHEMAAATLDFALNELAAPRVVAIVDEDNTRSIALLEKLGFRAEGRVPSQTDSKLLVLLAVGLTSE